MVVGGTIHARFARPWLEAPFGVGEDHAITLVRKGEIAGSLRFAEFSFTKGAALALFFRGGTMFDSGERRLFCALNQGFLLMFRKRGHLLPLRGLGLSDTEVGELRDQSLRLRL